MARSDRFLVVEDDSDGEFLSERAVLRKFKDASVHIVRDAEEALTATSQGEWTGFIVHRALDVDGIEMVRRLRAAAPAVTIVMVSGRDQRAAATTAGATHFLPFNRWQRLADLFASHRA